MASINVFISFQELGTWIPKEGECGTKATITSIRGGLNAKFGEFPYMALLGYGNGSQLIYKCGGSVINKWYILTAAHCVIKEEPS